jgi:hypothetical protein
LICSHKDVFNVAEKNICTTCGNPMSDEIDECDANKQVTYPDGLVLPVSLEHFSEPNGRCHDCSIKHGRQHHPGCDVERCPRCGGQRITCGCENPDQRRLLEALILERQLPCSEKRGDCLSVLTGEVSVA